jgi:hypothetical protein
VLEVIHYFTFSGKLLSWGIRLNEHDPVIIRGVIAGIIPIDRMLQASGIAYTIAL